MNNNVLKVKRWWVVAGSAICLLVAFFVPVADILTNRIVRNVVNVYSIGTSFVAARAVLSVLMGACCGYVMGLFMGAVERKSRKHGREVYLGAIMSVIVLLPTVLLCQLVAVALYDTFSGGMARMLISALLIFASGAAGTVLLICAGVAGGAAGLLLRFIFGIVPGTKARFVSM